MPQGGWGEMPVQCGVMNARLEDGVDERDLQVSVQCLISSIYVIVYEEHVAVYRHTWFYTPRLN
jgi:hypothetical protein